jgi:hypothetical protein
MFFSSASLLPAKRQLVARSCAHIRRMLCLIPYSLFETIPGFRSAQSGLLARSSKSFPDFATLNPAHSPEKIIHVRTDR